MIHISVLFWATGMEGLDYKKDSVKSKACESRAQGC